MADLFDVSIGGVGWHFTSHLIALAALFIACFAIAGYIHFRDDSVPDSALHHGGDNKFDFDEDVHMEKNLTVDGVINGLTNVAVVDNTTAFVQDADSIVQWTQPANTVITGIQLYFPSAVYSTGAGNNLGYEVGNTASGQEIVATVVDQIIDTGAAGTDIAQGALMNLALAPATESTTTLAINPRVALTTSQTIYLNTTCDATAAVVTPGTARWIINYQTLF